MYVGFTRKAQNVLYDLGVCNSGNFVKDKKINLSVFQRLDDFLRISNLLEDRIHHNHELAAEILYILSQTACRVRAQNDVRLNLKNKIRHFNLPAD